MMEIVGKWFGSILDHKNNLNTDPIRVRHQKGTKVPFRAQRTYRAHCVKGATRKTKKSTFFRFFGGFGSKNVSGWPKKNFFWKKSIFWPAPKVSIFSLFWSKMPIFDIFWLFLSFLSLSCPNSLSCPKRYLNTFFNRKCVFSDFFTKIKLKWPKTKFFGLVRYHFLQNFGQNTQH